MICTFHILINGRLWSYRSTPKIPFENITKSMKCLVIGKHVMWDLSPISWREEKLMRGQIGAKFFLPFCFKHQYMYIVLSCYSNLAISTNHIKFESYIL